MAVIEVDPRPTPAERPDARIQVEVDNELAEWATAMEDWGARHEEWEFRVREGHEFDRPNNVECEWLFAVGECTSRVLFRLDQLSSLTELGPELTLIFEERNGIAKAATLTPTGVSVEIFHILTYT
jgi:hypothetical protein